MKLRSPDALNETCQVLPKLALSTYSAAMRIPSDLTSSKTLLNSLRAIAVTSFLFVLVAMLFPSTQRFLVGACVSFNGMLMIQIFRLKSIEERPDPRDQDITRLKLNGF